MSWLIPKENISLQPNMSLTNNLKDDITTTMTFYTNVLQFGNSLLVREVDEKGQRTKRRVQYQPTLFDLVTTKEKQGILLLMANLFCLIS